MQYDLMLCGGRLLDPMRGRDETLDLAIADGKIVDVGRDLDPGQAGEVFDARGLVVMPGIVDPHVHVTPRPLAHRMDGAPAPLSRDVTLASGVFKRHRNSEFATQRNQAIEQRRAHGDSLRQPSSSSLAVLVSGNTHSRYARGSGRGMEHLQQLVHPGLKMTSWQE